MDALGEYLARSKARKKLVYEDLAENPLELPSRSVYGTDRRRKTTRHKENQQSHLAREAMKALRALGAL